MIVRNLSYYLSFIDSSRKSRTDHQIVFLTEGAGHALIIDVNNKTVDYKSPNYSSRSNFSNFLEKTPMFQTKLDVWISSPKY